MIATAPQPTRSLCYRYPPINIGLEDYGILLTCIGEYTSFVLARLAHIDDGRRLLLSDSRWVFFDLGWVGILHFAELTVQQSKSGNWTVRQSDQPYSLHYPSRKPYPLRSLTTLKFENLVSLLAQKDFDSFWQMACASFRDVAGIYLKGNRLKAELGFEGIPSSWEGEIVKIPEFCRFPRITVPTQIPPIL